MDRNENGYPGGVVGGVTDDGMNGTGQGGCGGNNSCGQNHTCGGGGCLDGKPLAYLYCPDQRFRMLYSAEDSLAHGTLFEELFIPMEVYGRE